MLIFWKDSSQGKNQFIQIVQSMYSIVVWQIKIQSQKILVFVVVLSFYLCEWIRYVISLVLVIYWMILDVFFGFKNVLIIEEIII